MKEKTQARKIRFKISTIKNVNAIAAIEGRTFAAQVRVIVEKSLKKKG